MIDTMIGVDLAKNVFQLHGASLTGEVKFRKKLSRPQFRKFMTERPACIVVFEACGGAHYWAHEVQELGHQAKLIAPQYVKPFVKRQKNDAADAEAIVIAAQRPEMRFVEPKSNEQIARGVLFRARDRLVRQRTEQINALRSVLYEQGQIFPKGAYQMKKVAEFLQQTDNGLLPLVREECEELLASISDLTARINAKTLKLKMLSRQSEISRRLQTIPGVGPLTAMAIEAFAPPMDIFRCGRNFAAWLGLVPKQHSTGGKARLGKVSKEGQVDIRRLLIIGAMTRIAWMGRKSIQDGSWLDRMLNRKPRMLVAIALANKMARSIWAVLTKEEDYRDPATIVTA
ncbi:MAG: IS110 family transposase [Rhodobacter sp.]|nr:IS110 family transposase [Rhodobacter sp.]